MLEKQVSITLLIDICTFVACLIKGYFKLNK